MSYSDVFGGENIAPSQPSYLLLNPLTADIVLDWPIEQSMGGVDTVASIIDVNATAANLTIQLGNAEQLSTGSPILFNNIGGDTFTVLDSSGDVLATVASGTVWQLYLSDNTTTAGTWRVFQFGAGASNANAAALAGAGLVALTTTLNQNYTTQQKAANYVSVLGDRSTLLEWTGGNGTLSVPGAGAVPAGWFVAVKNSGSGVWTVSVATGTDIDGETTLALDPEQSCFLIFDGTNYATLGLGIALNSIFNFVSISLTGQASPFVLSGAQLNRISYEFTGVLTAAMVVVVPNTVQQYWINNQTTGAFTLTFETPTPGGTVAVAQGTANILYSDGTNVIAAVSSAGISLPLTVADGGTDATTAGQALINLGGGTVGIQVFEAASTATAQAALGIAFSGATVTINANVALAAATSTPIVWNAETTNTGPWHSTSVNPTRLTVPAGVTVARISGQIVWTPGSTTTPDNYSMSAEIRKNGATLISSLIDSVPTASAVAGIQSTSIDSGPINVATADYFELVVSIRNTSGTTGGSVLSINGPSQFMAEALL
jgi:hypothetical protein